MDMSDLQMMLRLPDILQSAGFDKIIKQMLDAEHIPSYLQYTPCEFTESGLSSLPRILPCREGPSRERTSCTGSCKNQINRDLKPFVDSGSPKTDQMCSYNRHNQPVSRPTNSVTTHSYPEENGRIAFDIKAATHSESTFNTSMANFAVTPGTHIKQLGATESAQTKINDPRPSKLITIPPKEQEDANVLDQQRVTSENTEQIRKVGGKLHFPQQVHYDESTMSHTIQTLLHAYAKYYPDMPRPGTEAIRMLRQEQSETRQERNTSKMSADEAFSMLANNIVKMFENVTVQSVNYAKQIPGFLDFRCADQITLIKESRQECSLFDLFRCLNHRDRVFTSIPGTHFTFEEVELLLSRGVCETIIEESTKDIWQTIIEEEQALLMAIILTDADRCESLQNREQIQETHRHLVACLKYVVDKGGRNVEIRQEEMRSVLQNFRYLSTTYRHVVKERLTALPAHANNPTLKEIF